MSADQDWELWEVFVRSARGLAHQHAGSLRAPDAVMALRNARDLFTRRAEGTSIWVVPSESITASHPEDKDAIFAPSAEKTYRLASSYPAPEGVVRL
jgi:phenylacetate-CoA oxygenase PaaH subunit